MIIAQADKLDLLAIFSQQEYGGKRYEITT